MVKQLIYDSCMIVEKGTEVHRGRGFASKSFNPSAEADGKREPTATRQTSFVSSLINHHLQVQIFLLSHILIVKKRLFNNWLAL